MSHHGEKAIAGVRLSLPATSANLGPGFDAVGLALSLQLSIEAHAAAQDAIRAVGRGAAICGAVRRNLILETYREVLAGRNIEASPLRLEIENDIPLGMGCGSSAAARVAGVALANHFGRLEMGAGEVVTEATRFEGHPDNVAACVFGGFTVAVPTKDSIAVATTECDGTWQLLLALPQEGLSTEKARAMLPEQLSREDAVFNIQRAALLTAAFAQQQLPLLRVAMEDRLHQPHRRQACGLLEHLHALHGAPEFAGVALSGAGPALLGILAERATLQGAERRMRSVLGDEVELLPVRIGGRATVEAL